MRRLEDGAVWGGIWGPLWVGRRTRLDGLFSDRGNQQAYAFLGTRWNDQNSVITTLTMDASGR